MVCKAIGLLALVCAPVAAQQPGSTLQYRKPVDSTVAMASPAASTEQAKTTSQARPADKYDVDAEEKKDRAKYLKLPPLGTVFAFPNDAELEKLILNRLREDEKLAGRDPFIKYPTDRGFPVNPPVGGGLAYVSKTPTYPPMRVNYDALYITHRRLHFEEKNAERYGWDLGIIQPFVSTAYFYKDAFLLPNSLLSGVVYGFYDTNVGKCLPGSPTPYMLYPPGLTLTGTTFEAVVITGAAFVFP